jgi:hypothetical protein|tara:strand:- start:401 stop:1102 length:702 start_codon:yes stop_codon:yes gene_type:complete
MSTEKELNTDNLRDTHWLGEVIDNVDPLKMGRCKVKVLGKYDNLPDDAIPWATPMNRNAVGSHHVPRIGDIVSARFDNGNLYHPEYWFHIEQNLDLKEDILDGADNAENVISLVYDAERNVRIYHSEEDGLVITRGLGAKERPIIQIDEAGDIKISTDARIFLDAGNIFLSNTGEPGEDTEQPAVRGLSLEEFLANFIADYKAHIHPTGVGPSSTLQVPFDEGDHKSYQQENK